MTEDCKFEDGLGQDYWIREFHKIPFPGMELFEVTFFRRIEGAYADKHQRFKEMAVDFLKDLGKEEEELYAFEFSETEVALIKKGRLPENYTVHLKYPLEYGCALIPEQFVLMPIAPYYRDINTYIFRQLITDEGIKKPHHLYVPTPTGRIYKPYSGDASGSGGKSNTSQMAAMFNQGRGR